MTHERAADIAKELAELLDAGKSQPKDLYTERNTRIPAGTCAAVAGTTKKPAGTRESEDGG